MAAKAQGIVFSCRRRQEGVERGAEGRGMDRARERRGFPLFKHALMATFALAGGRKGLFDGALRHSWLLRECAAVRPVSEKPRNPHARRNDSDLYTDRVSHHHTGPSASTA